MLFADVKGSMELAESVDPEEWHRILDRFFQILADGVHRFEGTINQYTGDGIMALFGAPIAHEDHAQRACYAALQLQQELRRYANELRLARGLDFAVRIGIHSGEVVVGKIGDDLRMDYTAQGAVVGLAARLQELAEAGKAYVSGETARRVEGYFRFEDLGEVEREGRRPRRCACSSSRARERCARASTCRARAASRASWAGATRRAALDAALERALAGDGPVIGVVADAGAGKSRLCFELLERCRARGIATTVRERRRARQGGSAAPGPRAPAQLVGITEHDAAWSAREKIAGQAAAPRRELPRRAAARLRLPRRRRSRAAGTRARPERTAARALRHPPPRDPAARPARAHRDAARRPALVRRGERGLPGAAGGRATRDARAARAELPPGVPCALDAALLVPAAPAPAARPRGAAGAAARAARQRPLARRTHRSAGERTGGNPFFLEEQVLSLAESGALAGSPGSYRLARPLEGIAVPATVQAVLAARIDRLAEREKVLLQTASVIGRELPEGLLRERGRASRADLAEALRALVRGEFLYEAALYPEPEYAFKHPLTQEVAYQSQLAERRARVHAAVARALEALDPAGTGERAALLAHHYEAAGEALPAARWHDRAADWALRADFAEARRHWERVRALAGSLPDSREAADLARRGLRAAPARGLATRSLRGGGHAPSSRRAAHGPRARGAR